MKHLFTLVRQVSALLFFTLISAYTYAQCTTPLPGQVAVEIEIATGTYATEQYWTVKDSTGATVASVTAGTYSTNNSSFGPTANSNHQLCLDTGATYTFEAYDSFGDGWNGGTYEVRTACLKTIVANNGGTVPNNGIGTSGSAELETTETFTVFAENLVDMGVTAINEPLNPLQPGAQQVKVQVENMGTDTITSYTIDWTINGIAQTPFTGVTPIPPCGGNIEVTVGTHTFANLPATISAWSSTTGDNDSSNDTAMVSLCPGMSGTFTVDANSPTSGANFQSFADLLNSLNGCGIAGAVTVNVVAGSGPYNEQVIFTNFPGLSSANSITINGNGNELSYTASFTDKRIVGFDGASHITIDSLTIKAGSSTYGYGIHLQNQSDSNTITNCTIDLSNITSTSSSNSVGILASASNTSQSTDGDNANFNSFTNNTITGSASGGPYYGIYLNGQGTGSDCYSNEILNNVITDFRAYGIYLDEADSTRVHGNKIGRPNRTSITTFYGIYSTGKTQNTEIYNNEISNNSGGNLSSTSSCYAIYNSSNDADVGKENKVINNLIHTLNSNGTIYAIYNSSSNGVWYIHNTVDLANYGSPSGTTRGFYQTSTASNIVFQNNIVSISRNSSGSTHALYFNSTGSTITSNNNGLYVTSGNVGRYSSDYATLANWQTANAGAFDQNSVFAAPGYVDPMMGDFTPSALGFNAAGANLSVPTDFYGMARGTTPDIGAIEFSPPANDVAVISIDSITTTGRQATSTALSATQVIGVTVVNNGTNAQSNIPVTFDINGSVITENIPGTLNSGDSIGYVFTVNLDLSAIGNYDLTVYSGVAADTLNNNDTLNMSIRHLANPVITLPYVEDFEMADNNTYQTNTMGLGGLDAWDFETNTQGAGRLQTQTGFTLSGTKALSLDRSTGGTVANDVMQTVNLSNYSNSDSILLSFSYRDHGEENHTNDKVWVRGNENDPWIQIYDLWANKVSNNWKTVDPINITAILAANTQGFSSSTQVRFGQEDNSTLGGDGFTFEDVIWNISSGTDIGIVTIDSLSSSCGLTGAELVGVTVENFGFNTLPIGTQFTVTIMGANAPFTETVTTTSAIAPNGQLGIVLTNTIDLSAVGNYDLVGYTTLTGDTLNNLNDTAMLMVGNIPTITTYPYLETFDQGNGGWISGGNNNSWELTTPNNVIINSAYSGANSWVTNSTGNYNASENSFVEGPCFDFTTTPNNPHVAVRIWYEAEFSWDGMAMQYTTDGTTWNTIGAVGDQYNWYNDGTLNGNPGGQQTGWTGRNGSGSNGWITAAHELDSTALAGQANVKFRMVFGADGAVHDEGVAFDNFAIGTPTPIDLGNDMSVCDGFVFMPTLPAGGEYLWSTGDTTSFIELNNATASVDSQTISLIFIDSLGFPAYDTIVIGVYPEIDVNVNSPITYDTNNVSCFGGADGEVKNNSSGGMGTITYSWTGPNGYTSTADSLDNLSAGWYYVTATDSVGCMAMDSIQLKQPSPITVSAVIDSNVTCNGLVNGGASATVTGNVGPVSYLWSNTATTVAITGVAAGTYTITVTDSIGCSNTFNATITQPVSLGASVAVDSNVSCNSLADGGLTASATGGTMPYAYGWGNGDTTASITGLTAGLYSVIITDANGCTATNTATVTEPAVLMAATVIDSNASCNGTANGGATASGTGGTMPYSYMWSNGATTAFITGVSAGTYSVTISDANACTSLDSAVITNPAAFSASVIIDSNVTCNGLSDGGATASATGGTMPYMYAWSNASTNASITGVMASTYSVTVTDANGCSYSANGTITEPAALVTASVVDNNVSCNSLSDGGATASATGGTIPYTYAWSNAATSSSISNVVAGTYSVTITDVNGCTDSSSVQIAEPAMLVAASIVDSNISCNGLGDGGATASASGGTMPYTYQWNTGTTTASITGVVAGTYSVTITDGNGCTDSASVMVTEPATLVSSAVVDNNVTCNGLSDGGATASATGGTMPYTYTWSNAATTASITGVVAGTYSVTITDANGCTDSSSVTITEPLALIAASVADSNVTCNGLSDGGASSTATGGTLPFTYLWSNSAITASITGVGAGTYTVTITDANGCTSTASTTITEPTALVSVAVTDSNVTCNGLTNGGVSVSASGGTTPYMYLWSNGDTSMALTNLAAGMYSVTVTDANGCTGVNTATVTEPAMLVSTTMVDSNISCNGLSDGGATTAAAGGTAPYMYMWSNGATTASITGVAAGTYSLTITDANGCMVMDSAVITEPAMLTATGNVIADETCVGTMDGEADVTVGGGTMPYTYAWSNGETTASVSNLMAGTYTATVTDANGCMAMDSVTIVNGLATDSTFDANACYVYISPSGNHTWTTSGTYMDTITNSAGCDSILTINLSIDFSTFTQSFNICEGESVTVGNNTYTTSGTYVDTLINAANCDSIVSTTISVFDVDESVSQSGIVLTANNSLGTYQWIDCDDNNNPISGETNQSFTPTADGNYAVIVTENNCSDTSECVNVTGVGIIELANTVKVSVYPNPAGLQSEVISIKVENAKNYGVVIRNIAGKLIYQQKDIQTVSSTVNISEFASGTYFIEINADEHRTINKLIVL